MQLSAIKTLLPDLTELVFQLEDGTQVPRHFHVTQIGAATKHFIDCGGTIRTEKVISFQLWDADDHDHRLEPGKLAHIIALSEQRLRLEDGEIEIEYQSGTIGRYALDFDGQHFLLRNKATACLSGESCSIPEKPKKQLNKLNREKSNCCSGPSGCC